MAKSTKSGNVTFGSLQLHEEFTVTGGEGTVYSKVTAKRALVVAGGQTHVGRNFEAGSVVFPTGTKAGSPSVADKVPSAGRFPPALTVAASEVVLGKDQAEPQGWKEGDHDAAPTKSPEPAPAPAAEKAGVETTTEKVPAPVGATAAAPAKKPGRKAKAAPAPAPTPAKSGKTKAESNGEAKGPRKFLGKNHEAVLRALSENQSGLTRGQIAEAIQITSGFTSLLGHVDAEKREEGSLAYRGFITPEIHLGGDEGTKRIIVWKITKEGRQALKTAEKEAK